MGRFILFVLVLTVFVSNSYPLMPQIPFSDHQLHFFQSILRYTAAQKGLGHNILIARDHRTSTGETIASTLPPLTTTTKLAAANSTLLHATTNTTPAAAVNHFRYRRATLKADFAFSTIPPRQPTMPANHRDGQILQRPSPNQIIEYTNRAAVFTSYATYHDRCSDLSQINNGLVFERCIEYLLFFEQDLLDPAILQQIKTPIPTPDDRRNTANAGKQ